MNFREWYKANLAFLVTQPYTEFVAAAAWKAAEQEAQTKIDAMLQRQVRLDLKTIEYLDGTKKA